MTSGFANGTIISHYELLDFIGQGSMGRVFKARDLKLDRLVALKFLAPQLLETRDARERLFREAHALSALSYPNIATIYDIDQAGDQPFLALEYLEGGPLTARIKDRILPFGEIVGLGKQLAAGLNHAHHNGIIHRDVKPANALFGREGVLKLVDFGLAKSVSAPGQTTNTPCGTLAYMAPEQARGDLTDSRSDLFSLGVILYQMASGKLPFEGKNCEEVMKRIFFDEPTPLSQLRPDLPKEFCSLVTQSLEKDPRLRVESAGRVLTALDSMGRAPDAATQEAGMTALPTLAVVPSTRRQVLKRTRWGLAFAATALAVTAIIGMALWNTPKRLVVLPFQTESSGQDAREFADGVQPILTSGLVGAQQSRKRFWVLPPGDARAQNVQTTQEARSKLGADLVITGSIVVRSDEYVLVAHLTDAREGREIESRTVTVKRREGSQFDAKALRAALDMLGVPGGKAEELTTQFAGMGGDQSYEFVVRAEGILSQHKGLRDVDRAEGLLQQAVALEGKTARNQVLLAEACMQKFDLGKDPLEKQRAADYANFASGLVTSRDVAFKKVRARILMRSGNAKQAVAELRAIVEADDRDVEAWRLLALAYATLGDAAAEEAALRRAIDLSPGYWQAHANLGYFLFRMGRLKEAESEMRIALAKSPSDAAMAYRNLGGLCVQTKRYDEARVLLTKSIEIEPDDVAYLNLCNLEYYQGNYTAAASACEQAANMVPHRADLWEGLGDVYSVMAGKEAKARDAYGRALELTQREASESGSSMDVLCRTAFYQAKLGQLSLAKDTAAKAIAAQPKELNDLWILARALAILGDREGAIREVSQSLKRGDFSYEDLGHYPELASLKSDPRLRQEK